MAMLHPIGPHLGLAPQDAFQVLSGRKALSLPTMTGENNPQWNDSLRAEHQCYFTTGSFHF